MADFRIKVNYDKLTIGVAGQKVTVLKVGPQGVKGDKGDQGASDWADITNKPATFTPPVASNSTLGGIIVGSNLSITNNGVLSANIPPGGVTAFNGRTGNVTLTANDVTAVANGIYQANGSYLNDVLTNVNMSYGIDALSGMRKSTGIGANFLAGRVTLGTTGLVGVVSSIEASAIEFSLGDIFATLRIRQYAHTLIIQNSGFEVETGTANWTWSANSILTQGRGDARYQPVGSYLTSANLTWSNITGKPTFATVATSGSYTDLANTPNLSLYLTTANAANTYLPSANFTYANITGKPTLANVATSGNYNDLSNKPATYTLPAATNSTLGGIIVGSGLAIANGVLSSTTVNIDGGSATTTGTGSYDGGSAASN